MKKIPIFLIGCFILGIGLNFVGCSSTPAPATPAPAVGLCASPSSQGLATVGASSSLAAAATIWANAVTLATAETATAISLSFSAPVSGQVRFAIYNDNAAYPGNLVVETSPQNITASQWNSASLPNVFLPAGTYWLAFQFSNTSYINYNSSGGLLKFIAHAYGVFPDTFPASGSSAASDASFYITTCP
jgi:uncharacterized protein (DUF2141 family)